MGFLAPALSAQTGGRAPWDDYWYEPRSLSSTSSATVTPESALTYPTVYACTVVVSEDIAKVPLNVFEDLGVGGHRPASTHPLQAKLHDQPNRYQSALEWREMATAFALLRGRAVNEIRKGDRPFLDDEYVPLHPDLVTERVTRNGRRVYDYRDPMRGFAIRTLTDDEVFVLRGRFGRGVLDFAANSIGLALDQERHAGNLFARGANFQGAILRDKPWNDVERGNFRAALDEYTVAGQFSGRPLLLEDGMTWQAISLTAQQAELVDSRRFSNIQACQWFRVPPHKVFELERSTNNNIERQAIDYVTDSLLAWAERWEQAIWRDLVIAKGRYFAEHNLDGLLRGDLAARSAAYALAIQWGWMTRNEVRAKENMNPIKGGDLVERPLNMEQLAMGGNVVALRGRLRLHASSAAGRVLRREMAEIAKFAERTSGEGPAWREAVEGFYARHGETVSAALHIADDQAVRYAQGQRDELLARGPAATETWLVDRISVLTDLAMNQEELAA